MGWEPEVFIGTDGRWPDAVRLKNLREDQVRRYVPADGARLTAEQVHDAVKRGANFDFGEFGEYVSCENWQAIADELNAALGGVECENLAGYPLVNFECSVCGCEVYGGDELGANIENGRWNFCPNCDAKVVKR